eukprot:maker-scaffold838_size90379-snap-gene-0.11 protein:Tk02523 transcript:maker-scaffold838_size90379-snap-gene-0.11-mRNA-1 annotation:"hypothetical protein DAPPUDRAFT_302699"
MMFPARWIPLWRCRPSTTASRLQPGSEPWDASMAERKVSALDLKRRSRRFNRRAWTARTASAEPSSTITKPTGFPGPLVATGDAGAGGAGARRRNERPPGPLHLQMSQLRLGRPGRTSGRALHSAAASTPGRIWRDSAYQMQRVESAGDFPFSLMTYNILADDYAQTHAQLYQDVNPDDIRWEVRLPRLLAEIEARDPDVLCLQEVQEEHYGELHGRLTAAGYVGVYKKKTHFKPDGCAIFFKSNRFELVATNEVELFQSRIFTLDRPNIGLFLTLQPRRRSQSADPPRRTQQKLVVGTTHLLYNPKREDVRLAQTILLLAELDRISSFVDQRQKLRRHPCIITGDFNLQPFSPVYNLLCDGHLSFQDCDSRTLTYDNGHSSRLDQEFLPQWLGIDSNCQHIDTVFNRGVSSDLVLNPSGHRLGDISRDTMISLPPALSNGTLNHSQNLRSVYHHGPNRPDGVTTFQNGWVTVDYIFYSTIFSQKRGRNVEGNLKLLSRLLSFSGQEARVKLGSLPSSQYPSDHLCLMAEFLLKDA